jgi:hypothetical protein
MNGAFEAFSLVVRMVSALVEKIRAFRAQERFDRVERGPAAEFLRRFKRSSGSPSSSGAGERDDK